MLCLFCCNKLLLRNALMNLRGKDYQKMNVLNSPLLRHLFSTCLHRYLSAINPSNLYLPCAYRNSPNIHFIFKSLLNWCHQDQKSSAISNLSFDSRSARYHSSVKYSPSLAHAWLIYCERSPAIPKLYISKQDHPYPVAAVSCGRYDGPDVFCNHKWSQPRARVTGGIAFISNKFINRESAGGTKACQSG